MNSKDKTISQVTGFDIGYVEEVFNRQFFLSGYLSGLKSCLSVLKYKHIFNPDNKRITEAINYICDEIGIIGEQYSDIINHICIIEQSYKQLNEKKNENRQ